MLRDLWAADALAQAVAERGVPPFALVAVDGGESFDSDADFRAHDVIAGADRLRGLAVRIDCGGSDPFAGAARRLIAACPEPPAGGISTGCHEAKYWRRMLPAQLDGIGAALA
jgi:hypothetical protein